MATEFVSARALSYGSPTLPTDGTIPASALQARLSAALEAAGMPDISLYEGTKHSFARDAIRRGVPERHLQTFLGHASIGDARGGRIVVMDAVGALRSHGGSVQIGGAGGGVMAFA